MGMVRVHQEAEQEETRDNVGFGGNGKSIRGLLGRLGRALVIQCRVDGSHQFALSFNPLWFVKITG